MSQSDDIVVRHYTGWIPVVSGNMSFTEIGKTRACRTYQVRNERSIRTGQDALLIFGKKNTNDGWFPPFVRRSFEKLETEFYFLLVLRSQSVGGRPRKVLRGYIALSPTDKLLRPLAQTASQMTFFDSGELGLPPELISESTAFGANIEITRNGRCDLKMPDKYSSEIVKQIAEQFFVFIKDAAHHHYHHETAADSITYAHPNGGDELSWRSETLYSLHRAIVSARRYKTTKSLRQSLGISSYAEAFESGFLCESEANQHQFDFQHYAYKPIRTSIQALHDTSKASLDKRVAATVFLSSITVATAALILASSRTTTNVAWPDYVQRGMTYATGHPIAVLLLAFFTFQSVIRLAGQDEPFTSAPVRWAKKIYAGLAFLPRWIAVLILAGLGVLAAVAAFFALAGLRAIGVL